MPERTTFLIQPMDQGAISIAKNNMKYHLLNDAIQFTNGNNKTFMDFLKQIDILDVIYWLEKAWSEVPQSALNRFCNKILLGRKTRTRRKSRPS